MKCCHFTNCGHSQFFNVAFVLLHLVSPNRIDGVSVRNQGMGFVLSHKSGSVLRIRTGLVF